jgi:hypothetical protein
LTGKSEKFGRDEFIQLFDAAFLTNSLLAIGGDAISANFRISFTIELCQSWKTLQNQPLAIKSKINETIMDAR